MPIYPRKWETGRGLGSYLKRLACWGLFNMPSSSLFSSFTVDGSEGFEACPHFQTTMQLREQRMKLKLSMQSNMRQWCLRITENAIEAHVHPHTHTHVSTFVVKHINALNDAHAPLFLIQPTLINQWGPRTILCSVLGLKDAIVAPVCFNWYLFTSKSIQRLGGDREQGSLHLEQRNQGGTLPSCEKKKGRLTSSSNRQIMEDLPA